MKREKAKPNPLRGKCGVLGDNMAIESSDEEIWKDHAKEGDSPVVNNFHAPIRSRVAGFGNSS